MKIKDIMLMVAAMIAAGACTSDIDKEQAGDPVAIKLTATVEAEILRSGDYTTWTRNGWCGSLSSTLPSTRTIQENILANNQKIYLWADKGSAGTYEYLKAWELTSEGDGNLSSTTTQYYPSDALTFRAVHGNFTSDPIEGTTAIGELTHTVDANQSATGAYERSDLMYATGSGSWESGGTIDFIHQLSKIEINLLAGPGFIPSDLENVVVQIKNVKPSITINAADGTLGLASGDAITVTARRTGTLFEAVIPPQDLADGSITILRNGVMQTIPTTVASFVTNSRYVYNVNCSNRDKHLNPLWYVAENNVRSYNAATNQVTLETYPASAGSSQCYNWTDAMAYFAKQSSSYDEYWAGDIYDGSSDFKYHLPCQKEWFSVLPSNNNIFDTSSFMPGGGKVASAQTCIFGYSSETKVGVDDVSYWSSYTDASKVRYAIRFLGTAYCSVWKYELSADMLTITAKLIDYLAVDTDNATLSSLLTTYTAKSDSWWNYNDEIEGAIQRKIYSTGYLYNSDNGGTGVADFGNDDYGIYWGTTETTSDRACRLYFLTDTRDWAHIGDLNKRFGFNIRLFRSDGPSETRTDTGIPLSDITTSHIGMVLASNGKVYATKAIADMFSEGVAMIGHVSSGQGYALSLWDEGYGNKSYAVSLASNCSRSKPAGTSWSLPTMSQWCQIFANFGGSTMGTSTASGSSYSSGTLRTNMVKCGGEEIANATYWSSTPSGAQYPNVTQDYTFSGRYWSGGSDSNNCYVRLILTF